jgi:hypothetical protein
VCSLMLPIFIPVHCSTNQDILYMQCAGFFLGDIRSTGIESRSATFADRYFVHVARRTIRKAVWTYLIIYTYISDPNCLIAMHAYTCSNKIAFARPKFDQGTLASSELALSRALEFNKKCCV